MIAGILAMTTFFNTSSRILFPVFTLSHYSALQYSRRKSLRFFTLESESLYTIIGHQVMRSKYCQNLALGSASRRIFFHTNFTRVCLSGIDPGLPVFTHKERIGDAQCETLFLRIYFLHYFLQKKQRISSTVTMRV